jgi:hypothetical protein
VRAVPQRFSDFKEAAIVLTLCFSTLPGSQSKVSSILWVFSACDQSYQYP